MSIGSEQGPDVGQQRPGLGMAIVFGLVWPGLGYLVAGRPLLFGMGFVLALLPTFTWLGLRMRDEQVSFLPFSLLHLALAVAMTIHAVTLIRKGGLVPRGYATAATLVFVSPFLLMTLPRSVTAPLMHALPVRAMSIPSGSMEPVVKVGDHILVQNRPGVRVGDLVIYRHDNAEILKWIVAGPGDRVEIVDGRVLVNGQPSPLPFKEKSEVEFPSQQVPPDCYFMLGANINNSLDSRMYGPIRAEDITGKVIDVF